MNSRPPHYESDAQPTEWYSYWVRDCDKLCIYVTDTPAILSTSVQLYLWTLWLVHCCLFLINLNLHSCGVRKLLWVEKHATQIISDWNDETSTKLMFSWLVWCNKEISLLF